MSRDPLKIAYITMQYPVPSETFASNDINELLNCGNTVDVFCLRPKLKNYERLFIERHSKKQNISVYHINLYRFILSILFCLLNPIDCTIILFKIFKSNGLNFQHTIKSYIVFPSIINIFLHLRKQNPDIVHLFWGHYPSILVYFLNKFMPDVPCTMFLGAHDLETGFVGSVLMSFHAKIVFTHSHENVERLIVMGIEKSKIRVLYRGVSVDSSTLAVVKNKEIKKDSFRFLTAARLIDDKGVDEVIDVFAEIINFYPSATLTIAGDGIQKNNLLKRVKALNLQKKVDFLGHLSQDILFSYMVESDYFILMSRYKSERLPNVIKEAMLRKCVCITTPTTGINELIDNNVSGFIFNGKKELLHYMNHNGFYHFDFNILINTSQQKILNDFDVRKIMNCYQIEWKKLIVSNGS